MIMCLIVNTAYLQLVGWCGANSLPSYTPVRGAQVRNLIVCFEFLSSFMLRSL